MTKILFGWGHIVIVVWAILHLFLTCHQVAHGSERLEDTTVRELALKHRDKQAYNFGFNKGVEYALEFLCKGESDEMADRPEVKRTP